MLENKKVSLVVAIYKSELFLNKLIKSLINQTYENIEIILVDDGSPDNSGKICDEFARNDKRIKVIHKNNEGPCQARNDGIKAATGDYLVIIDGDDWLEKDFVEYMMHLIVSTKAEMAFSYNVFTTRDRIQIKNDVIETMDSEAALITLLYPYIAIGPWNKIYDMNIIKKFNISFSVPWFGEGLYFATKVVQHANHVGVGRKKVYNYRLNNYNSGLTNYNVNHGFNALKNIKTIRDELIIKTPKVNNAINWHIWKNYNFLLLQIIGTNSKSNYLNKYIDCKKYIKKNMFSVFLHSKVNAKEKIKILFGGMFPVFYAHLSISKSKRNLKKDVMK